jgi:signal peptidase II
MQKKKSTRKGILLITITSVILLALDQYLKWLARAVWTKNPVDLGFASLIFTSNTGSSFSMLQGWNGILIWVSVIALGAMVYFSDKLIERKGQRWFFMLLLVGIIGNLIDRIAFGQVIDFFALGFFPVFNIADSCLTIGVIGYIIIELIGEKK